MKGRSFRNQEVGSRLQRASAAWIDAAPENYFERKKFRFFDSSNLCFWFFIIVLHLQVLTSERDFIPTLTIFFPLIAGITFSSLFARYTNIRYDERNVLLPLSEAQVHREILREWRTGIILPLLWILFLGFFLVQNTEPWVGSVKCLLLFISMTSVMSLYLLPFMSWLSSAVIWGFGGLLFLLHFGPFGYFLSVQFAPSLPWYVVFSDTPESWAMLGGIILAGLAAALTTKRHWLSRPDFDCTYYYENISGFSLEDLRDIGLNDETISKSNPSPPTAPQGTLESFVWRFLSAREKVLARATGLCSEKFLSRWFILTVTLVALSFFWQRYSGWSLFYPNIIMAISLIWLILSFGLKSFYYFTAIEISPNCAAAAFAVLPIGLKTTEKLFFKEGLPKWTCLSLTITLVFVSVARGNLPAVATNSSLLFIFAFFGIFLSYSLFFWATGTKHWLSNKKRWRYSLWASLCFLGSFMIMVWQFTVSFAKFWEFGKISDLWTVALSFAFSLALFFIGRALMILRINNLRCDLLNQLKR